MKRSVGNRGKANLRVWKDFLFLFTYHKATTTYRKIEKG